MFDKQVAFDNCSRCAVASNRDFGESDPNGGNEEDRVAYIL